MVAPPSVAHAVVRSRALAALEARWDHPVTTVVADAGFGKSVAIGQALRANDARPRGIEAWVSCRSGAETPDRLAAAVEAAFGTAPGGDAPPLLRLQGVFAELAPVDASLVLDDLETLGAAGVRLVDELLRRPPANLHLVLSGRPPLPAVALARFRAAGDLVEVTAEHLRFDDGEIAALARSLGAPPPRQDLGGWPALVRLALSSPEGAVGDYLWEEVISGLAEADRQVLLALCVLGASRADELSAVSGVAVDPDGFCARVPLVQRAGERLEAHQLWAPFRARLGSGAEIDAMASRATAVIAARGDAVAWGELAVRLGDTASLRRAAVALVQATLGSLPVEVADRWLAELSGPGSGPGGGGPAAGPEVGLLHAALAHARSAVEPPARELDRVADQFLDRGDGPGAAVAVALAAVAAEARGDLGHLMSLAGRARALVEQHPAPLLDQLVAAVDAAAAAMGGDIAAAVERLDRSIVGIDATRRTEALARLHWHLLLLAGRAHDAAESVAGLHPAAGAAVHRELEAVARWLGGDPGLLLGGPLDAGPERYRALSDRDRFDQASFVAPMAASIGDVEAVDRAVDVLTSSSFSSATSGPDAAVVAMARACQAILDHDDDRAAAIVDQLTSPDLPDPFTDAYLRRSLAVPYVCSPGLRRRWDHEALGPAQEQARRIARRLLDARTGTVPAVAPAPLDAIAAALPLPWSVELAARAVGAGASWGPALTLRLADLFGDRAFDALARLAAAGDGRVRRGATRARRAVPIRPAGPVEVLVLGPLELRRDGRFVDAPELRRTRVRELLSLLVVEPMLTRERAIDVLWPDRDLAKGRANLRFTLGHLQRVLEPERPTGAAPYFLRVDTEQLRLADVPGLEVDAWQVAHDLAAAAEAARRGDLGERVARLRAGVSRWRGRPLPDLDRLAPLSHHGPGLVARLTDAALTLGELELVAGAPTAATLLAEQVRDHDPYDERAHRLAIAAALQARDRARATTAMEQLRRAMADLGTEPEATTRMLVHNATRWLGGT